MSRPHVSTLHATSSNADTAWPNGECKPLAIIAQELRLSEPTLRRHVKAQPEVAQKLATSRTHKRGGSQAHAHWR
jgi:hypothetical protein